MAQDARHGPTNECRRRTDLPCMMVTSYETLDPRASTEKQATCFLVIFKRGLASAATLKCAVAISEESA
jgi:hypothetical protein